MSEHAEVLERARDPRPVLHALARCELLLRPLHGGGELAALARQKSQISGHGGHRARVRLLLGETLRELVPARRSLEIAHLPRRHSARHETRRLGERVLRLARDRERVLREATCFG